MGILQMANMIVKFVLALALVVVVLGVIGFFGVAFLVGLASR